jgi:hypothetical protein
MDAAGILTVDASASARNNHTPPSHSAAAAAAGPPGRTSAHSVGLIFMRLALERLAAQLVCGRQASGHSRPHEHLCSVLILAITPDKRRWQAAGLLLVATLLRVEYALRPQTRAPTSKRRENAKLTAAPPRGGPRCHTERTQPPAGCRRRKTGAQNSRRAPGVRASTCVCMVRSARLPAVPVKPPVVTSAERSAVGEPSAGSREPRSAFGCVRTVLLSSERRSALASRSLEWIPPPTGPANGTLRKKTSALFL